MSRLRQSEYRASQMGRSNYFWILCCADMCDRSWWWRRTPLPQIPQWNWKSCLWTLLSCSTRLRLYLKTFPHFVQYQQICNEKKIRHERKPLPSTFYINCYVKYSAKTINTNSNNIRTAWHNFTIELITKRHKKQDSKTQPKHMSQIGMNLFISILWIIYTINLLLWPLSC